MYEKSNVDAVMLPKRVCRAMSDIGHGRLRYEGKRFSANVLFVLPGDEMEPAHAAEVSAKVFATPYSLTDVLLPLLDFRDQSEELIHDALCFRHWHVELDCNRCRLSAVAQTEHNCLGA